MAKNRKKKYRPTYTTGGRVDMRTGGRVKAQVGGMQPSQAGQKPEKPISTPDEKPVTGGPVGQGVLFNGDKKDEPDDRNDDDRNDDNIIIDETAGDAQGQGQAFGRNTIASEARQERIARTEAEAEARAAGQVPSEAIIDPVSQEAGTAVDEDIKQATTTMQDVPGFVDTTVTGTTAEQVTPETVTTGDVTEAKVDKQITAATFDAIVKNQPANVQAAIQEFTPELKDRITAQVQEIAQNDPTKAVED